MNVSGLSDTFKTLGPVRLGVMASIVVGLLIFFVFVTTRVSQPDMQILYSDLTNMDASAVAGKLEASQIAYRVSDDGTSVFVPESEVGRSRMLLAEAGLPNGGSLGYEIFDQSQGFGQTQFVQNINQVRALQGELARTIAAIEPVQFAKVHLVLPQRQLFERQAAEATGSVTIKLKNNERLTKQQIYAIQNLVANAVPGLGASRVSLIDSEANLLAGGDAEYGAGGQADDKRRAYEQRLQMSVEELVGRVVGFNKVRAQVTADLNFDVVSRSREIYDPEGQVVRSTQVITDTNNETEAGSNSGAVSVEQNLPGLPAGDIDAAQDVFGSSSERTQEVTNFEINKTIESITSEMGEVTNLSVAVLVDGNYTTDEEGNKTYEPRSEQEIERLTSLVRSAVGYDEDRGDRVEVVNLPFADIEGEFTEPAEAKLLGFEKKDILGLVEMLTLSIMVMLVLLLVVRPVLSKILAAIPTPTTGGQYGPDGAYLPGADGTPALVGPGGGAPMLTDQSGAGAGVNFSGASSEEESLIDMEQVEGRVKTSSIKKVSEIVGNHPTETVSVIRNWMSQD